MRIFNQEYKSVGYQIHHHEGVGSASGNSRLTFRTYSTFKGAVRAAKQYITRRQSK